MRSIINLHFSSTEAAVSRFLSHSICSFLIVAKRFGGRIKRAILPQTKDVRRIEVGDGEVAANQMVAQPADMLQDRFGPQTET